MIAGGIVAVVAVGFFIVRRGSLRPEASIGSLLKQLDDTYTVLTGSIVQGEHGMIRLDHTVVSRYGVFIIKECREAGPGRGAAQPGGVAGGRRGTEEDIQSGVGNPQSGGQKLEGKFGKYPYIPLVVFTRARLAGDSDFNIMEAGKLVGHIQGFRDRRLSEDRQEKIIGILS